MVRSRFAFSSPGCGSHEFSLRSHSSVSVSPATPAAERRSLPASLLPRGVRFRAVSARSRAKLLFLRFHLIRCGNVVE
jgi:hypothetical protein